LNDLVAVEEAVRIGAEMYQGHYKGIMSGWCSNKKKETYLMI